MAWYLHERDVLITVLHLAAYRGWDRAAANIAIDWRPMNQEVDTDAETYPHALAALEAAIRAGDDVLIAELHRDVGPKAVRLGFPAERPGPPREGAGALRTPGRPGARPTSCETCPPYRGCRALPPSSISAPPCYWWKAVTLRRSSSS